MWNWKTKLTAVAVPAVLAVGGAGMVAQAAAPPTATPPASAATEPAESATETPGTEPVEANEPNLPGGGHADPAGQVDNQFEGVQ